MWNLTESRESPASIAQNDKQGRGLIVLSDGYKIPVYWDGEGENANEKIKPGS